MAYGLEGAFLDADERTTMELAAQLLASGSVQPLIARLRAGEVGPEHVRAAFRILVELDSELLVRVAVDGLISGCVENPEGNRFELSQPPSGG